MLEPMDFENRFTLVTDAGEAVLTDAKFRKRAAS